MVLSEITPLLPPPQDPVGELSHWKQWRVVYLYAFFILVGNFGSGLRFAPELRLMELAVCRRYHFSHDPSNVDDYGNVPEALCKTDVVQSQLAMLRAYLSVLNSVAGILVALPFGILADIKGRRPVAALSSISITLSKSWIILACKFATALKLNNTGHLVMFIQATFTMSLSQKRSWVLPFSYCWGVEIPC
jgi:hypothetical protein